MLWACVPVAAIDEDGDALLGEDDVRAAAERRYRTMGDSEAKAGCVQPSPYCQLRRGVPGAVALHDLPGGGAACPTLVRRHAFIIPPTPSSVREQSTQRNYSKLEGSAARLAEGCRATRGSGLGPGRAKAIGHAHARLEQIYDLDSTDVFIARNGHLDDEE